MTELIIEQRNQEIEKIIDFLSQIEKLSEEFNTEDFLNNLNKESKERSLNFKIKKIAKQKIRKTIFFVFCLIHDYETAESFLIDLYYTKSFDEDSFKKNELKYVEEAIKELINILNKKIEKEETGA